MSLTCVSCFFPVKAKHPSYYNWFANTLAVNCPYVFFTNRETVDIIKLFRKELPTYYILYELEDLYMYRYKDRLLANPDHCPSVEVSIIWNEKIILMEKASTINPFNSEWFKWMDAGMSIYRLKKPPSYPFPLEDRLAHLPKDKFIYSLSDPFIPHLITETNYYHHVSGTFLLHKSIIPMFAVIYKLYAEKLFHSQNIWTEQVLLTHIFKDHPQLFYKLGDGYGIVSQYLYGTI